MRKEQRKSQFTKVEWVNGAIPSNLESGAEGYSDRPSEKKEEGEWFRKAHFQGRFHRP